MNTPERIGRLILERLEAQARANRAAGNITRELIRAVVDRHPGEKLSAQQVLAELPRKLSLRRTQEILRDIRAESSASRL